MIFSTFRLTSYVSMRERERERERERGFEILEREILEREREMSERECIGKRKRERMSTEEEEQHVKKKNVNSTKNVKNVKLTNCPHVSIFETNMYPGRILDVKKAPHAPYRRRKFEKKTALHWGQRKLLISEIEFLTEYADLSLPYVSFYWISHSRLFNKIDIQPIHMHKYSSSLSLVPHSLIYMLIQVISHTYVTLEPQRALRRSRSWDTHKCARAIVS